jgi:hypothetical protein
MKIQFLTMLSIAVCASQALSAANLLINLRSTSTNASASKEDVDAPYLTLDPGHDAGTIAAAETSWNNFSSTGGSSSLVYGDGAAAAGITLTFGTEATAGSGTINLGTVTGINTSALYGSGGFVNGQRSLVGHADSIYGNGNVSGNSAVGRAGWLGASNSAIGLRVDGLVAGEYRVYVMARNTNSNAETAAPMNLYATTGSLASTFDFSSLSATVQANTTYPTSNTTAYNEFVSGENFVAIDVTLAEGQSLFLASDGASAGEPRGFINMVQVVAIPEPSVPLLAGLGLLALVRRRR